MWRSYGGAPTEQRGQGAKWASEDLKHELLQHRLLVQGPWLAPAQVIVATITSDADEYAEEAARTLRAAGLRVEVDTRNEKINYKVREHSLRKVPVIAVVGQREADDRKVALRRFGSQGQEILGLDEAASKIAAEATPPDLRRAGDE